MYTFSVANKNLQNVNIRGDEKPNCISGSQKETNYNQRYVTNGFVTAVCEAYNHHHHLILRPDDVWFSIMSQFCAHVGNNSEELRSKFVSFDGKKQLTVEANGNLFTADYSQLCNDMSKQIAKNIKDPSIRDWVIAKFSTTTPVDTVAYSIILMASMKNYFDYKFSLCCGIPKVTLKGTVEDWRQLEEKAKRLLTFDNNKKHMATWYKMLAPVLSNFTKSREGNPNIEWWQRVCSHHGGGSGPSYLSGWITVFTVFNDQSVWVGDQRQVNATFGGNPHSDKCEFAPEGWPVIDTSDLPKGYVDVPLIVDDNGTEYKCKLLAGHMSVSVKETEISPRVDWLLQLQNDSVPSLEHILQLQY